MDIIKFNNPTSPTKMEQAEIVEGLTSKLWIERYLPAGEFTLIAPATHDMKAKLPIGSLISHLNTTEIMIVENHEISANEDNESELIISGRGFETYLENRIVNADQTWPGTNPQIDYWLATDWTWNQAWVLLVEHILASRLLDDNYELPYVSVMALWSSAWPEDDPVTWRFIKRGPLYDRVLDILAIQNLGLKVIRPGPWSPLISPPYASIYEGPAPVESNIALVIHKGTDKSASVILSYDTGEIVSADYLWSQKNFKNAALVTSKWFEWLVSFPGTTKYEKRVMWIDGSDIDQDYDTVPTGLDYNNVLGAMVQRGWDVLASLTNTTLTKAEVSRESVKARYRSDYDVGDLVMVQGDYNATAKMRVTEYVEYEDETGESGYPTLSLD